MRGANIVIDVLRDNPGILVLMLGAIAVLAFGPRINATVSVARSRQRDRAEHRRKCDAARKAMLDQVDAEDFYGSVGAYLKLAWPQDGSVELEQIETVIDAAGFIDITFESEGIEWALAHWTPADFDRMIAGARHLGLDDMVSPIRRAQSSFDAYERAPGDTSDPAWTPFEAHLAAIQASFAARGGNVRFHNAANDFLRQRMQDFPGM
ncbi:hypothetical protein R3X27_00695 [Tropicimonas sp. TH_r6]|uniref:hypothetical protein n=1 Tax=Tropicimonas sp. TH_r6 TaxID=3082085 RepID=UPI00295354F7|nr:hypothetical protein [Tropicimonas sp. TH_r6]MDV7141189.1 hypothetical protein [Tropicimonas sp. TH_r6]